MFTVYVLKSVSADWFYVGMTTDFDRRLSDHNRGYNLSTKSKAPFIVIFTEVYNTSLEARNREKFLKNASGKRFIRNYFDKNKLEWKAICFCIFQIFSQKNVFNNPEIKELTFKDNEN